ncbi:hypothetical protein HOI18_00310, partial [Candidatus Uhrbacteria bacterium]|nr:hypothetical protein [Candidatus Uhrbacteria bacterium]
MPNQTRRRIRNTLLLIIPFLVLLQVSLYLTLQWKFGAELNNDLWQRHVILFIFPHLIWIGSFYGFRLFDLLSYQHFWDVLQRIILASLISIVGSISFIYFQPELLLTP